MSLLVSEVFLHFYRFIFWIWDRLSMRLLTNYVLQIRNFIKIPPGTLVCAFWLQYWLLWICESTPISTLKFTECYRWLVPQRSAIWLYRASRPRLRKLPKLWKKSYIRSDKTRKRHQACSSTDVHEISRLNLARVTPCVSKIKNVYTILQSARFLFFIFLIRDL